MTSTLSAITYAGRSGTIEPSASVGRLGVVPRPAWLDGFTHKLDSAEAHWFSRFVPPDEGGRESAVLILFGPPPAGSPTGTP